ncbi:hypothetical protein [Bacillus sp. OTU2372]|uniref:hypothetical protein n=1 Tax=Bacillus sp. OTU2372 TaxID=3043858 RepID=UPI00313E2D6D
MINRDSIRKSMDLGFYKLWFKYENYEIIDDHLIGNGIVNEIDAPMAYSELPGQVAKLNNRKEKYLLKFVKAYGLFGYKQFNSITTAQGEPLNWIWAHVQGIYMVLELLNSKQDSDIESMINVLKQFKVTNEGKKELSIRFGNRGKIGEVRYPYDTLDENTALSIADNFILLVINKNISEVKGKIYAKGTGINSMPVFKNTFNAMIEAVYWQLMVSSTGGGTFRRCKFCNTPFVVTHDSTLFCPKKDYEKESTCAINFRVKKMRAKAKKEK